MENFLNFGYIISETGSKVSYYCNIQNFRPQLLNI